MGRAGGPPLMRPHLLSIPGAVQAPYRPRTIGGVRPIVVGAQVSAAGGVSNAAERALGVGARAVQIFVDQNRRYPRGPLPHDELERLRALLRRHRLPGYVHVPYLANVATADDILRTRSIEMIARAVDASSRAGLRGVVVHPGSHRGRGFDAVREQVVLTLAEAWRDGGGRIPLLIENTAGAGGHLAAVPSEMSILLGELRAAGVRCGACIDLSHAHAQGWDLATRQGVDRFQSDWRLVLPRVRLVHANDSSARAGSRHDRHANPGAGTIGARGFRMLAEIPQLARVPWILEVPGKDHSGPRRIDVRRLDHILNTP